MNSIRLKWLGCRNFVFRNGIFFDLILKILIIAYYNPPLGLLNVIVMSMILNVEILNKEDFDNLPNLVEKSKIMKYNKNFKEPKKLTTKKVIKKEKTDYEYNHKTTKTPSESHSGSKGGSYEGTPTGQISKRKDAKVITKYSPLIVEIKDELNKLAARQAIGKRRQLFR